jgi:hypothetical protein
MDVLRLFTDYSVPTAGADHRHYHDGWINTACPFCTGNPGMHLGYNTAEDYFHCWRCGGHPTIEIISRLINVSKNEARQIIHQYGGQSRQPEAQVTIRRKAFKLPSDTGPLSPAHRQYLLRRGFDPDRLVREWGILSAGPIARLDDTSYKHRIIIPITWQGTTVSFQGRAANEHTKPKYKACPKDRELVAHQDILYGQQAAWGSTGIITEGVTDVWRLGTMACATFGIDVTREQIRMIARSFKRVAVVFDEGKTEKRKAKRLIDELLFLEVEAWPVWIAGDPGSMTQNKADKLIKQILS